MAKDLCRLVYRSESRIDHNDDVALDGIFRISVKNNLRDRITGALGLLGSVRRRAVGVVLHGLHVAHFMGEGGAGNGEAERGNETGREQVAHG